MGLKHFWFMLSEKEKGQITFWGLGGVECVRLLSN